MTVELLHTEGCPYVADYLPHLQQLVASAGVDEPVRTRVVSDNGEARRERFLGSPTVRVDGIDVDPSAEGRLDYRLDCRQYTRSRDLNIAPLTTGFFAVCDRISVSSRQARAGSSIAASAWRGGKQAVIGRGRDAVGAVCGGRSGSRLAA
jgi:hypothetical protein